MFSIKQQWWLGGLKTLIGKIDDIGSLDRRSAPGSGRPRTAGVADDIDEVDDNNNNNNMLAYKAPVCQRTSEAPR